MKKREILDFNSFPSVITQMVEDSSITAGIIDELIQNKGEKPALPILILLDDMNIRGVQISTLYKMCHQNIEEFYEKVINIKEEDIDTLNYKVATICPYKAIYNGSKEEREKDPDKYLFTDEERNEIKKEKEKHSAKALLNSLLKKSDKDKSELYPTVQTNKALEILKENGFNCGYQKMYENNFGEKEIYRVFYNKKNDLIVTHSKDNEFLIGKGILIAIRQSDKKISDYRKEDGISCYVIDLKEKPFETYQKIENEFSAPLNEKYYSFLPVIESEKSFKYKINHHTYQDLILTNIIDLFEFTNTYEQMNYELKKLYKNVLETNIQTAYDKIIKTLTNTNQIIETLQNLNIKLEKEEMLKAKERFLNTLTNAREIAYQSQNLNKKINNINY